MMTRSLLESSPKQPSKRPYRIHQPKKTIFSETRSITELQRQRERFPIILKRFMSSPGFQTVSPFTATTFPFSNIFGETS
ncbi:hypothetical protein CDAR_414691 [Caerostris darwini]|uniref:Uncharacterized protein n=1 Tax=Caerostris darwini TaxID=1538125 RepID=A0AAV4RG28_9ARAC|nr:hypothetical protein CDAR_414691 [Caerostris darwini]